jgi:hypothetical protein
MARPRGFARWAPKDDTIRLLQQVQAVLDEYEKFLPLTARQVFYRLVGHFGYDKTEQAYARLCEHLVRARRAGMISFASIRDDGTSGGEPLTYADVPDFWRSVTDDAKHYSRDRLNGQSVAIEFWCEAAGMVPQLRRVAYPFSVPVYSTGGFSSVTVTHEIAQRALKRDVPTVFLHVGDYDPSGESIFESMSQDARMFVRQVVLAAGDEDEVRARNTAETLGGLLSVSEEEVQEIIAGERSPALRPERVALTVDQVEEHGLETAPPKRSDSRSANWIGDTCQLEAMPPDALASTVREAIEGHLDLERYEEECDLEAADKEQIGRGLELARKV